MAYVAAMDVLGVQDELGQYMSVRVDLGDLAALGLASEDAELTQDQFLELATQYLDHYDYDVSEADVNQVFYA